MTATATTTKTDELLQRLTEGVEKLTSSDEWIRYLDVQRRFHRYSFGNVLLIALQCPDATRVAGFRRWLELGRHVQRGQKGIAILAPVVHRLKVEDEETGEKRTIVSAPRAFRVVHVFDVSQTDGDELPEIPCHRLEGEGAAYSELTTYAEGLGFGVEVGELPGETNGLCNRLTHTITVREGLAPAQQTKTLAHEIAHAILHGSDFEGPRAQAELEAESVAYIVCAFLELDSAQYSWGYLASWGAAPDAMRRSGHRIQQAAQAMLNGLGMTAEGGLWPGTSACPIRSDPCRSVGTPCSARAGNPSGPRSSGAPQAPWAGATSARSKPRTLHHATRRSTSRSTLTGASPACASPPASTTSCWNQAPTAPR